MADSWPHRKHLHHPYVGGREEGAHSWLGAHNRLWSSLKRLSPRRCQGGTFLIGSPYRRPETRSTRLLQIRHPASVMRNVRALENKDKPHAKKPGRNVKKGEDGHRQPRRSPCRLVLSPPAVRRG